MILTYSLYRIQGKKGCKKCMKTRTNCAHPGTGRQGRRGYKKGQYVCSSHRPAPRTARPPAM